MAYDLHITDNPLAVNVHAHYLPQQSNPAGGRYRFAYTITITNQGQRVAQVIARHWVVTDSQQHVQEVRGLGIVGTQPVLQPGDSHTYTSACELATPTGQMQGHFLGMTEICQVFVCPVVTFALDAHALAAQYAGLEGFIHVGPQTLH